MHKIFNLFIFLLAFNSLSAQGISLQGYVFEIDNRGYISQAKVDILQSPSKTYITSTLTDADGFFKVDVPSGQNLLLRIGKDLFLEKEIIVEAKAVIPGEKKFVNIEMERKPGYIFDVTIADPRKNDSITTSGILGATVEVFNNTTEKEYVNLPDYEYPNFKVTFEQGNHYTILIRKQGYYAKRMEAYVNVKGCILCFDGVGSVQPGVSDVLTAGHQMGTLLANVELKPIVLDEKTKLDNINYALGSAKLNSAAKVELRKVVDILKDNPGMKVELSSHTDSRGADDMNMKLSQLRAKTAKEYITSFTGIQASSILGRGYGETRLDNGCTDGVQCNERQHKRNRRTEIRILEFNQKPKSQWNSLAELKRLERMEIMLQELQNQEVVQIPIEEEKEIPDDLKKELEDKEKIAEAKAQTPKPDLSKETEEEIEETEIEMVDTPKKILSQKEDLEKKIDQSSTAKEEKTEVEVATSSFKSIKTLPADYTGYRIQVYQGKEQLPAEHEMFKVFGNMTLEEMPDGYAYLLGDFQETDDANLFLENIIQPRYPKARLIGYQSGKRHTPK